MKNTKTTLFSVASSTIILLNLQAAQAEPNFEIFNKAKNSIGIGIMTKDLNNKKIIYKAIVESQDQFSDTVNSSSGIIIDICPNTYTMKDLEQQLLYGSRDVQRFNIIPQGRTIYITWNPDDETKPSPLYPQTGPWKGWLGKYNPWIGTTASGLRLDAKTNVKQDEIEIIEKE
jgi:hypothetical protein